MTILDAMNAAPRRHKPSYEVTDYGAKFESGGSLAGLDLPPALPGQICAACLGPFTRPEGGGPITGRVFNGEVVCLKCEKELQEEVAK